MLLLLDVLVNGKLSKIRVKYLYSILLKVFGRRVGKLVATIAYSPNSEQWNC